MNPIIPPVLVVVSGIAASIVINWTLSKKVDPIRNPNSHEFERVEISCPDYIPKWMMEESLTDI